MPSAFVSYSWDSESHKAWIRDLSTTLREDGVDVKLDQWELVPGDQLPEYMERAVRESEYVLIICTHKYKERSDKRLGGVGYEGDIMSAEVYTSRNQRKFIPILREAPWELSAPSWLSGKYYIDLSGSPYMKSQYDDLLTTLLGTRPKPPSVRVEVTLRSPASESASAPQERPTEGFDPIGITGIIADQVGTPRGDGTRGSSLYRIPFRLSQRPPRQWAEFFIDAWNRPSRFTAMHRPGIASVRGDVVVLDGTTLDEVQRYHRDTLILAANEANSRYAEAIEAARIVEEREAKRLSEHRRDVEEKAKGIRFDDD
jgi:hypothetical protein